MHDFGNVQVVLDLLYEFLCVLTKDKTCCLSSDFNQNYLFLVIRAVVEGEHFYSINRMLIIIYDFLPLLSEHGRYQVAMFLLGNSFFKLFYHWSTDIRNTFFNILLIRIKSLRHRRATEILERLNKALDLVGIIEKLQE